MRGMAYFPLLGMLIGGWAAAFYDAAASLWPPLVAAAISMAGTLWLTGCFHEDGLCDTLDGFGGGWTKSQILKIMRDSRNGSYATMGGCIWVVAKAALIAHIGGMSGASVWGLGVSKGAGPSIVVAQCLSRMSAAPLIYAHTYIVDDEDAKGEYYNWFGDSRRLLGAHRVLISVASAAAVAAVTLPREVAGRALLATTVGTVLAGGEGHVQSVHCVVYDERGP
jgi:cobalamin synthase